MTYKVEILPTAWEDLKCIGEGYRMVICGKHVAIYKQIEKIVYVYHIADTQTEYTKLFY